MVTFLIACRTLVLTSMGQARAIECRRLRGRRRHRRPRPRLRGARPRPERRRARAQRPRRRGERAQLRPRDRLRDGRAAPSSTARWGRASAGCRWARRAGLEVARVGHASIAARARRRARGDGAGSPPTSGAARASSPPASSAALAPLPTDGLAGGLHAGLDLRVDPRRAVAALAALLDDDPGAPRHVERAGARDRLRAASAAGAGDVRAPLVIVCPGPDHDWLDPELRPCAATG